ncbi:hypothetical protein Tco_1312523 [Tanacetum coccineum]
MRDEGRSFIVMKNGNGEKASVIYDNWCGVGILQFFITNRDLYNARRNANMIVKYIVENGSWTIVELFDTFNEVIRMRLLTLKEKKFAVVINAKKRWNVNILCPDKSTNGDKDCSDKTVLVLNA